MPDVQHFLELKRGEKSEKYQNASLLLWQPKLPVNPLPHMQKS